MAYQNYQQPTQQPNLPSIDYDGDVGTSGTYDEGQQELLRLQIDVSDLIDDFEHRVLRGEYLQTSYKTGEKKWVRYDPDTILMNELGVREVLACIVGRVTKAAKLTYKEKEEAYKDLFYFHMWMAELVAKRCDKWEMDPEMAKVVLDSAISLVWDVISSSIHGFTAINLRASYQRTDLIRSDSTQKEGGKSFLGIPLSRK